MAYVLVALGSAIGGVARYWCSGWITARAGAAFPWGTLSVNVAGSFLIGVLGALSESDARWSVDSNARQLLMVGVLGGFTTFSAFSLQTLLLLRDGQWLYAAANVASSVCSCLIAVWLGFMVVHQLRGL